METICKNCVEEDVEDDEEPEQEGASKSESGSEGITESCTGSNPDDLPPYIDEDDDDPDVEETRQALQASRDYWPVYREGLPFHLWAAKVLHDYQRSIDREKNKALSLIDASTGASGKDIPDHTNNKEAVNKHVHPDDASEEEVEHDIADRHRKKQCLDTND
jgi:hypothetical protein